MLNQNRVKPLALKKFLTEVLETCRVDPEEAAVIARNLVWTDSCGHWTQGTARLPEYLNRLEHNLIRSPSHYSLEKRSPTIAVMDGNNGWGHYLGHVAMSHAIETALEAGTGIVGLKNSNHNGAIGYYPWLAVHKGCIGITTTNAVKHVVPFGGIDSLFGTNPMAFGAPMAGNRFLIADFSSGKQSGSRTRAEVRATGKVPHNTLLNQDGQRLADPQRADYAPMLPFGGAKGSAIAFMVEILSAVLVGGALSVDVRSLKDMSGPCGTSQFFMAISIEKFGTLAGFMDRMDRLIGLLKGLRPEDGVNELLYPGERRWQLLEESGRLGIPCNEQTTAAIRQLARDYTVPAPPTGTPSDLPSPENP